MICIATYMLLQEGPLMFLSSLWVIFKHHFFGVSIKPFDSIQLVWKLDIVC